MLLRRVARRPVLWRSPVAAGPSSRTLRASSGTAGAQWCAALAALQTSAAGAPPIERATAAAALALDPDFHRALDAAPDGKALLLRLRGAAVASALEAASAAVSAPAAAAALERTTEAAVAQLRCVDLVLRLHPGASEGDEGAPGALRALLLQATAAAEALCSAELARLLLCYARLRCSQATSAAGAGVATWSERDELHTLAFVAADRLRAARGGHATSPLSAAPPPPNHAHAVRVEDVADVGTAFAVLQWPRDAPVWDEVAEFALHWIRECRQHPPESPRSGALKALSGVAFALHQIGRPSECAQITAAAAEAGLIPPGAA